MAQKTFYSQESLSHKHFTAKNRQSLILQFQLFFKFFDQIFLMKTSQKLPKKVKIFDQKTASSCQLVCVDLLMSLINCIHQT
jgi:hypothetical protein